VSDLSQLSDDQLRLLYNSTRPVSELSDDELKSLYRQVSKERLIMSHPSEYMPGTPGFEAKYGATSGMDKGDLLLAGAGKAYYDLGRGAKQITGNLSRQEVDQRKAMDAPLMQTGAGKIGNIGGNVALALPTAAIPGANTYMGAALIGGGLGALQPVGTQDSRLFNSGLGAVSAMGGKFIGDRIVGLATPRAGEVAQGAGQGAADAGATVSTTPGAAAAENVATATPEVRLRTGGVDFGTVGNDASAGLTATQREIMQRGQAIGMRTTPGQALGSRALQQFEAKLESQPMTSGPFNAIKANNAETLNRAAARSIGENANVVDSAVLDRAFTRIGNVFEDAGDDTARQIDPRSFLQMISGVQDDLRGLVGGFAEHPLVEDLTRFAQNGEATGHQLKSLTSKLGKAAYKQMTSPSGDRDLGMGLYQVKDYVDDLLQQGMTAERAATFQAAREQYRNLMLLTSRVGVVNPSTGNVSGRSLANVLQQKDRLGYLRGRNQTPMYDAARFAQAFAPIVGDSGTATRMPFQGVTDLLARVPLNLAARAYTSAPAINASVRAQAASQAMGNAVRPVVQPLLGPVAPYAPYVLPGTAGILAPQLAGQ